MKILVCGATGFMGRNAFEYFKSTGHEVYGVRCKEAAYDDSIEYADLTRSLDVDLVMTSIKPDVVIQAAATTSGAKDIVNRPYIHVTDNAVMNSLLLRAAFDNKVKHFIFLSCGVMYQPGKTPRKETDFNESDELYPTYFGVGWTKIYIEKMCEFYSRLGMKTTAIRHSNTYGPHDKYDYERSHVFGATIRKVFDAEDNVVVWGEGKEARDLIYVMDVIRAMEVLIEKQEDVYELVNVSAGYAVEIRDLVKKIIAASGKTLTIDYDTSKPTIPTRLVLDNTKMKEKYDWEPTVTIDGGIKLSYDWFTKSDYWGKRLAK